MPDDLKGAVIEAITAMARAFERIHSMPRTSDTELAERIDRAKEGLRPVLARLSRLQEENERLRSALETFAIMANDDTAYLPDEHIITLSYDDSEIDDDLGGPNTLLGERFMRAFRQAAAALSSHEEGGAGHGD